MSEYNRLIKESHSYKDHNYYVEVERADDRYVFTHKLTKPNGRTVTIDYSNTYMSVQDLHKYIDLGYPPRQSNAPLSSEEIAIMWNEYVMGGTSKNGSY